MDPFSLALVNLGAAVAIVAVGAARWSRADHALHGSVTRRVLKGAGELELHVAPHAPSKRR